MPGIQRERRPEATVRLHGVQESKGALSLFHDLCSSCQGPKGKIKFIQNTIGGSLTVTSVSKRLLSCISIQTPILKFISSAVQSHVNMYGDGGLFCASLASGLVLNGYNSDIHCKILSEIFETFLTLCIEYLNAEGCLYKHSADLADISFMSSYVGSILNTKPLCRLNDQTQKYLTIMILECFLNSVSEMDSCVPSENVYVTTALAESVNQGRSFSGVVIVAPEISKYKTTSLSPLKTMDKFGKMSTKVALITSSMSGDLEELANLQFEASGDIDLDVVVMNQLSCLCEQLVVSNVGVVLCQKVVHPRLKKQLRSGGVLVVDRIGQQPIHYISKLTGASPVGCLDSDISDDQFGWLDDVKHMIICDQSYIQLARGNHSVTTILLTHQLEESLNELKVLTHAALTSLDRLLVEPVVLCGGGCWQAGLVHHLRHKVQEDGHSLAQSLEIPRHTLQEACQLFTGALLQSSVLRDSKAELNVRNGHLYSRMHLSKELSEMGSEDVHCCCGLARLLEDDKLLELRMRDGIDFPRLPSVKPKLGDILEQRVLWDSLTVRRNAMQMAVLTACAALKIGQVLDS